MVTGFRDGEPILGKNLKIGLKVYMNNAWWEITNLKEEDNFIIADIEAKFKGKTSVTLEPEYIYYVDKIDTLGHKHQHIIMNDSNQPKEKKKKYPYNVVKTWYGQGNERGDY